MDANRIWTLLGKKLSGEASVEELREFDAMMDQGLGDIYPIHILEKLWHSHPVNPPLYINKALNDKWQRLEARLKAEDALAVQEEEPIKTKSKKTWLWISGIAASMLLCLSIFWYSKGHNPVEDNRLTAVTAPKGRISKIQLPDGSKVWLNSGSKIVYQSRFNGQFRKVTLIGEAFFDVVKDASHPFIVTTGTFQLKVLGTAFNVRSYPNDKTSEAALVRGKIQIKLLKNPDKEIILLPSEKLLVKNGDPETKAIKKREKTIINDIPLITLSTIHQSVDDSLPDEALWMENKLAFDNENFEEIASKMQRWFNVTIVFKNNNVKLLKFTGTFQHESLYKTLQTLQQTQIVQQTVPFHFEIKDNNVFIY
jgi:ferric-dicitrate binding protein FerR (iron transport regulator)